MGERECTCPEWSKKGGPEPGGSWVRKHTDPRCPIHGTSPSEGGGSWEDPGIPPGMGAKLDAAMREPSMDDLLAIIHTKNIRIRELESEVKRLQADLSLATAALKLSITALKTLTRTKPTGEEP